MITVLIVDSDPFTRYVLKKNIEKVPEAKLVGETSDSATALNLLNGLSPRVVLIGTDPDPQNALELAKEIYYTRPQTILIFTVSHEDYADEEFKAYAFYYLGPPFALDRIEKTMHKILQIKSFKATAEYNSNRLATNKALHCKLVVRHNEKIIFINCKEIVFITRENRKTVIYTLTNKINTTENLNHIEQRLPANHFFRSHRSFIVNLNMMKEISPWGQRGYQITFYGIHYEALLSWDKAKELEILLAIPQK